MNKPIDRTAHSSSHGSRERWTPPEQSTISEALNGVPSPDRRQQRRLTVVHSPDASLRDTAFKLPPDDVFLIGRGVQQSGFAVNDDRLSRLHFRIAWDGRQSAFRLGDAQSKNGTYVNGARTVSAALEPGTVIRAGDSLFVYDEGDPLAAMSERIERAARADLAALLLGETGSGKEVLARALHEKSGRPGAFVAVNCAAIPRDLVAAELFGHTRGAFSGAVRSRPGLFVAANGGTLLLDEVGDLPLEVQPALLRALQERNVRRVGAEEEIAVSVRVIAATHVDLDVAQSQGRFRDDLFARLAQVVFRVPPLRERRAAILGLANAFSRRPLRVTESAAEALLLWSWPRNVRELKVIVESFEALSDPGAELGLEHLSTVSKDMVRPFNEPLLSRGTQSGRSSGPSFAREELRALLIKHEGNISAVAKELGKARAQVYRWMKVHGLSGRRA